MKFHNIATLGTALALSLCMVSCAPKPEAPSGSGSALKIAICTSPNAVDDGAFNENVYSGIVAYTEKAPGSIVINIQETTGAPDAAVSKIDEIVGDYDVIVGAGFQFGGLTEIAKQNPDKKFILIDTYPLNDEVLPNVYAMMFAEQESGFFAGMAAALETKTNKVAVVNGQAFPSNVNYQFGFECGVKYINITEGKTVELIETGSNNGVDVTGADIGGNYTGDFGDIEAGKKLGETLIGKGCDIIFVAAGDSGNGVWTAVKEATDNVKIIGYDVDQYDDGANGDKNIILTSALKRMDICVERTLNAIDDGAFKGENVTLTIKDNATGYVNENGCHQLTAETVNKLDAAAVKLKDGSIVPAANFNGITPDTFEVK